MVIKTKTFIIAYVFQMLKPPAYNQGPANKTVFCFGTVFGNSTVHLSPLALPYTLYY